jgi:glycosyltransferase involved in cell wall biosynthesis
MSQHTEDPRIVWLIPGRGFQRIDGLRYTLPLLEKFQRAYPGVVFITTDEINPYYKKILNIQSRGHFSSQQLRSYASSKNYGRGFRRLPFTIVFDLLKLRPQLVISQEFTLWTILSALFKPIGGWKLIVLWTGSSPGIDLTDDPFRLFVRRLVTKFINAFITNSIAGKHYLQNYLWASNDHVFRIIFKPGYPKSLSKKLNGRPVMHETHHPRFLYVGQLIPRKGVNHLLSAWSKLQYLSPNHGSLLIIGSGRQNDELIQQARRLALKNVYFIGQVEYASLGSWYQSCDIFVLPTLEDTWANVIPEAMTFGRPILCSKYAGTTELVYDGENGFIFDPQDEDGLARLMLKLINSPDLVEKFGKKSLEIMEPYTIVNAVASFREVIGCLLKCEVDKSGGHKADQPQEEPRQVLQRYSRTCRTREP